MPDEIIFESLPLESLCDDVPETALRPSSCACLCGFMSVCVRAIIELFQSGSRSKRCPGLPAKG